MHVWGEQIDLRLNKLKILSQLVDTRKAKDYEDYFNIALKLLNDLHASPKRSIQKIQSVYLYNCDKCNIEFNSYHKRREHMIEVHSV